MFHFGLNQQQCLQSTITWTCSRVMATLGVMVWTKYLEAITVWSQPSYIQDADPSTVMHRFVFKCLEDAQKADFVIGNTVQELESSPISALQEKQPYYAIGPLSTSFTKRIISTNLLPASDYTNELARWSFRKHFLMRDIQVRISLNS